MREALHFLSGQETDREAGLGRAGGDGLSSLRQCQTTPFVESGTCVACVTKQLSSPSPPRHRFSFCPTLGSRQSPAGGQSLNDEKENEDKSDCPNKQVEA